MLSETIQAALLSWLRRSLHFPRNEHLMADGYEGGDRSLHYPKRSLRACRYGLSLGLDAQLRDYVDIGLWSSYSRYGVDLRVRLRSRSAATARLSG